MTSSIPVVNDVADLKDGDITIRVNGELAKPKRLDNGLYAFKDDTGFDRVVLDAITSWNMALICCGSKPKSPMLSKSPPW